MKKICFAASSGGHFEQLMMLKPLMGKYESFILTEETQYATSKDEIEQYYLKQINRKEFNMIFKFIVNTILSLIIFIKKRPDIVVSTGVLATIPMCMIAKIFGKKLIYIESFAKINSPTLTGKLLYKYADQFYIQWEELRAFYPNAIYKGGIY
ncbi:polysaccharide biosynthesis protein [Clostridium sp. CM028]|uniref:PssD/Cps14F family polysaccharide biosynthesis glycosyltransferase n=1 Tax=Clostridium sp. CM028 TaxID=2851575 RepID=UPI001C6F0321|nr:PssD/Cps14F family polysaccharide biosynthesis glycosyltransferase [Clostridium sp. CM028]MBW9148504.1 polysaccharide biosynthesis protein [Clostridium sp. CM028]WLC61075.1 polysaccharide biosynthesis protein [Clostridium sp. CM028]